MAERDPRHDRIHELPNAEGVAIQLLQNWGERARIDGRRELSPDELRWVNGHRSEIREALAARLQPSQ